MPRVRRPWFRFYVEATRDPKMRRLIPAERWLWVAVLSAARESPIPGFLLISERLPLTWTDLADYAGMKLREVEKGTDKMSDLGLLTFDQDLGCWFIPSWNERQFESDDVTERTTKHRSIEQGRNVPTSFDGTGNSVTETETETETDVVSVPKRNRRRPAHPIPDDLVVTLAMRQWPSALTCREAGLDLDDQFDRFKNFHLARDSRFVDWDSAFKTWLSNAPGFARSAPANRNGAIDRQRERNQALADRQRSSLIDVLPVITKASSG